MKKIKLEFYDIWDIEQEFQKLTNFNIQSIFDDIPKFEHPFEEWSKFHGIDPYRTKTKFDVEIIKKWQDAEDRENFFGPSVNYANEISRLIQDQDKFGVGYINLNTFIEDMNKNIGIEGWSPYWTKYEGRIYSLNQTFFDFAWSLDISMNGKLTVYQEIEQDGR